MIDVVQHLTCATCVLLAGTAQQSLEQKDTDLLIVDDKDFRVTNIR